MSKITIHDCSVPKVTFEEADTIARKANAGVLPTVRTDR